MGVSGAAGDPGLAVAFRRTGLTVRDLWLRYLALGGDADEVTVEAVLYGLMEVPPGDYNVLVHAVNEALEELPAGARGPKVGYLWMFSGQDLRGHRQ